MPSRRRYLALLGAGFAGCTGSPSTPTASQSPTDVHTATVTHTGSSETDAPTGSPTETPTESAVPPDSVDGSWTHPLHDAGRTGFSPDATGPTDRPGLLWSVDLGGQSDVARVADGRVHGWAAGRVFALDAVTGEEDWSRTHDASFVHGLSVVDGTVYFGAGETLHALDAATGEEVWSTTPTPGSAASPLVAGDVVYEVNDATVLALDRADGAERWRRTFEDLDGGLNPPAADGDAVYVADSASAGTVRALAAREGSLRWESHAGSHPGAVTVRDGRVYAGGFYGNVTALSTTDGSTQWSNNAGPAVSRILAGPRMLYAAGDAGDTAVACLAAWSGGVNWTRTSGFPVAAVEGTVFLAGGDRLVAVDPSTNERRWATTHAGFGVSVVDDLLFVTGGGRLRALR